MKPLHKRVPANMADEYIAKGWKLHAREGRLALLIWTHEGDPP